MAYTQEKNGKKTTYSYNNKTKKYYVSKVEKISSSNKSSSRSSGGSSSPMKNPSLVEPPKPATFKEAVAQANIKDDKGVIKAGKIAEYKQLYNQYVRNPQNKKAWDSLKNKQLLNERTTRLNNFKESTKNYANAGELLKDYDLVTQKTNTGATAGLIPKQQKTNSYQSKTNYVDAILPQRATVMEGLTVKKTAASEKYFANVVQTKSTIPGNIIYSKGDKIVGILDKKNNELIFTKGFNDIQEKKSKSFFDKVWEGGSSAMLTEKISKDINVIDDKYFGDKLRTLDYEESRGLWNNKKKNPLLIPSGKYDDFKAKGGKGNLPLDVMQGFTDSIGRDPLGNAAILAGSAGVGVVAGITTKVIGGTKAAAAISTAKNYNLFTKTAFNGVGIGAKTVIGTAVATSVSMDILTSKNPGYRTGEISKEFLFVGAGLKQGYKAGQNVNLPELPKLQKWNTKGAAFRGNRRVSPKSKTSIRNQNRQSNIYRTKGETISITPNKIISKTSDSSLKFINAKQRVTSYSVNAETGKPTSNVIFKMKRSGLMTQSANNIKKVRGTTRQGLPKNFYSSKNADLPINNKNVFTIINTNTGSSQTVIQTKQLLKPTQFNTFSVKQGTKLPKSKYFNNKPNTRLPNNKGIIINTDGSTTANQILAPQKTETALRGGFRKGVKEKILAKIAAKQKFTVTNTATTTKTATTKELMPLTIKQDQYLGGLKLQGKSKYEAFRYTTPATTTAPKSKSLGKTNPFVKQTNTGGVYVEAETINARNIGYEQARNINIGKSGNVVNTYKLQNGQFTTSKIDSIADKLNIGTDKLSKNILSNNNILALESTQIIKQTPILSTNLVLKSIQNQGLGAVQAQRLNTGQIQNTGQVLGLTQRQGLDTGQKQDLSLKTAQITPTEISDQGSNNKRRTDKIIDNIINIPKPIEPKPKIPKPNIPKPKEPTPKIPKLKIPKFTIPEFRTNTKQNSFYSVEIGKQGNLINKIMKGTNLKILTRNSRNYVDSTAAASLKFDKLTSNERSTVSTLLGKKFKKSKKEKNRFVEKNLFRMDNPLEKLQISTKNMKGFKL